MRLFEVGERVRLVAYGYRVCDADITATSKDLLTGVYTARLPNGQTVRAWVETRAFVSDHNILLKEMRDDG